MAEPIGTALSSLGLLGLLTVCLDCFNAVQDFTGLDKDYAVISGHFKGIKLRFRIWARACGFVENHEVLDGSGLLDDDPDCCASIQEQLKCIALLFMDGDKIVEQYCREASAFESTPSSRLRFSVTKSGNGLLYDYLCGVRTTDKTAGVLMRLRWVLLYKKKFLGLNQQLVSLIENLESISGNLCRDGSRQSEAIRREVEMIPSSDLQSILDVGEEMPNAVSDATRQRLASFSRDSDAIRNSNATNPVAADYETGYNAELAKSEPYRRLMWRTLAVVSKRSTEVVRGSLASGNSSSASQVALVLQKTPLPRIVLQSDKERNEKWAEFSCNERLNFRLPTIDSSTTLYDVMESLQGRDLGMMVEEYDVLQRAFGCLARGLSFIHRHSMRNRDICPQNILFRGSQVVYTNFGHAPEPFSLQHAKAAANDSMRRYRAPEYQEGGEENNSSDVFSLGCVFIEILTVLDEVMPPPLEAEACYSEAIGRFICGELCALSPYSRTYLPKYSCWHMVQRKPEDRWWAGLAAEILLGHDIPGQFFCDACAIDTERHKYRHLMNNSV